MRFAATLVLLASASAFGQLSKADPNAPENAARSALIHTLDELAAKQTAARREEIAKIHTLAEAKARQAKVRATMLRLLGPLPERTPLNAQVLGETQLDGFRIQKILFDSQPGFHVTALLYLPPMGAGEKLPAIVVAPGHGATGKASDFGFASTFARNGFAVLSYDPIGQGERLQYPDPADPTKSLATRPTGEHAEASLQPVLLGESVAKYFLWDGMRAVDYLQSRPEIDPKRIGAFGCSGGGAMTALLGALDTRIAATGTACYITSFDTLLPAIGPQDGEQSTPGWIAAGLDFPDWVELAAPRPYAIVSTSGDMFPYAGARASASEARRFYALFDPISAGKGKELSSFAEGGGPASSLPIPTVPTLNPDTANSVPPTAPLEFIVGPGGHGNLRPLQAYIVRFFLNHLAYSNAEPRLPPPPAPGTNPFALPAGVPAGALQVTSTGQVATAYPGSATVFSLNLAHFKSLPPPHPLQLAGLKAAVRESIGPPIVRDPNGYGTAEGQAAGVSIHGATYTAHRFREETGIDIPYALAVPAETKPGYPRKPAVLLVGEPPYTDQDRWAFAKAGSRMDQLASGGNIVMAISPRPAPAGIEEQKSPILGEFYLLGLRAELTGRSLLGMRVDDVLHALDELLRTCDVSTITAEASGHEALVLLHAAVLDPRLKHITLKNLPPSYRATIADPLPKDIAEDLVPGVLLHYDIPDLIHALGNRVTVVAPDNPAPTP